MGMGLNEVTLIKSCSISETPDKLIFHSHPLSGWVRIRQYSESGTEQEPHNHLAHCYLNDTIIVPDFLPHSFFGFKKIWLKP